VNTGYNIKAGSAFLLGRYLPALNKVIIYISNPNGRLLFYKNLKKPSKLFGKPHAMGYLYTIINRV
jgi:hypothetical protein